MTIEMTTPQEAVAIGEAEYAAVLAMLHGLSAEDWTAPTECPGWSVREMVAHLTGAAEEAVRPSVQARHLARARTRDRRAVPADSLSSQQIADRATRTPAQILAELDRLAAKAPRKRAGAPGPVRAMRLPANVGAPQRADTMAYLLDVTYNRDIWMHRIDIARATGCELVTSDAEAAVVAQVVRDVSRTWNGPSFTLTMTGRVAGSWRVGDGEGDAGEVTVDTVALCRLLSGRSDETQVSYDGPEAGVVDRLRETRVLF